MKPQILFMRITRPLLCAAACYSLAAAAAQPETPVLPRAEYRVPLEEIIVRGPYWRNNKKPAAEQPRLQLPAEDESGLRWAPQYNREERDDAREIRDPINPKPRVKLFEKKF